MAQTESRLERTVREEQEAHEQTRDPFAGIKDIHGNTIGEDDADRVRENEEATPPARELETDVDPEDPDEKPAEPTQPDPAGEALFDKTRFESEALALPKADDLGVDKIAVRFTGRVILDRSNENDVATFRRLKLGKNVELRVSGKVKSKGHGYTTNREGNLDAVISEAALDVDSVWILTGAEGDPDA